MYCTRCGKSLNNTDKFCTNCGEPITNNQYQINNNLNYNQSHQDQYNYAYNYTGQRPPIQSEEDYIKAFVGPNYEKIKNTNFSIQTFFLGVYYFLYRKMYLYSLIWILTTFFIIASTNFTSLIFSLIITITISINFKKIYLHFVTKKVDEIKQQNMDKSTTEILEICRRKGGVSIVIPILIIIPIIITSILFFILIIFVIEESNLDNQDITFPPISSTNIEELNYEIPTGFTTNNYNSNDIKIYSYNTSTDSCDITIKTNTFTNIYKTKEDYLNSISSTGNKPTIEQITINNSNWAKTILQGGTYNKYLYAIIVNNHIYSIEYKINNNNSNACTSKQTEFINSLDFNYLPTNNKV